MSTRSNIAVLNGAEGIKAIYCHSDGYPAYTGHILDTYYTPGNAVPTGQAPAARVACARKITDLIDLGDLSLLGKQIHPDPDKPHGFDYRERQPFVTVAYGRDRGEQNQGAITYNDLDHWHRRMWPGIDYAYLFVGGAWLCAEITDPNKDTLIFQHVRSMINPRHVERLFGT